VGEFEVAAGAMPTPCKTSIRVACRSQSRSVSHELAERIPEWCVVLGLIGGGQEIHVGEEAGLVQWRWAVERSARASEWTVHAPPGVADVFGGSSVPFERKPALNLDTELRFHLAKDLHGYVAGLLAGRPASELAPLAERLGSEGFHRAHKPGRWMTRRAT
jgi:hypothetical protein